MSVMIGQRDHVICISRSSTDNTSMRSQHHDQRTTMCTQLYVLIRQRDTPIKAM